MVRRWRARVLASACLLAVLTGCRGPAQPYAPLSPDAANLRAQFNADVGNVRIVLLPAPT